MTCNLHGMYWPGIVVVPGYGLPNDPGAWSYCIATESVTMTGYEVRNDRAKKKA